jgi:hypothetical protein
MGDFVHPFRLAQQRNFPDTYHTRKTTTTTTERRVCTTNHTCNVSLPDSSRKRKLQTKTIVQATKITGRIETISPNPAYSGRIENFTNAPPASEDREQIIHERPRKVPHDPPERALRDPEDRLDALVYVRRVEHDHVRCADGHICTGADLIPPCRLG